MYNGDENLRGPNQKVTMTKQRWSEYIRCKEDILYFAENYFYIVDIDKGKHKIKLREYQKRMLKAFAYPQDDKRHVVMLSSRQIGKALSLDTPIITPNGFSKVGDIKVGDVIYGRDGKKTNVTFVTDIMNNHDVYEIEFDNGEKIKADAEHIWKVSSVDFKKSDKKERNLTTEELIPYYEQLKKRSKPSCIYIQNSDILEFDDKKTDIHPYYLGLWLGDGNRGQARITCSKEDYNEYKILLTEKCGYDITEFKLDKRSKNTGYFGIYKTEKLLKKINVFKNKHIPEEYIFNSEEKRLDLLKGLMDSDGYINKKGTCQFYQSDKKIIEQVRLLLSTLGIKTSLTIKKTIKKDCYVLTFVSREFSVFNLNRKKKRLKCKHNHQKNNRIYIRNIKKINSEPVKCLQVDNNEHMFLCGKMLIPTHNTTISLIYLTHYALFNEDKYVALLANKEKTANEILRRIKLAILKLPIWLQQGISEANGGWNKGQVGFENGVRLIAGSTSSSAIRSESISLLYLDEFAFVPDNIADDFMRSVYPTVSSSQTARIIIVSTPHGLNHFYHIWRGAIEQDPEKRNNFMPVKINWNEIDGRNEKWKEGIIRDIGPQAFAQEYACKFLGSSDTLIDANILERLTIKEPIELKLGDCFNIYEHPQPLDKDVMYICGVDSAKGTGKDFSVVQVLKITHEHDIKQVATYKNNFINAHEFAEVVISISEYYNGAYLMVENNEVGGTVADAIWFTYEYDKILNCDKKGIGIRSTKTSKLAGNILLKKYVDSGWLEIIDRQTIYELSRYEEIRLNIFQAPRGSTDDHVMALLWALYFVTTMFFDGKQIGVKQIDEKFKLNIEEKNDDTPIMFYQADVEPEQQLPEGWGFEEGLGNNKDEYMGLI